MSNVSVELVKKVLPQIEFNEAELRANVEKVKELYLDVEITEETFKDGKKEVAKLNKLIKAVDGKRKEIKKEVKKPIDEFEAKIKDVISIIKEVVEPLKDQIDVFEEKRKQEHADKVNALIQRKWDELEHTGIVLRDKFKDQYVTPEKCFNISESNKSINSMIDAAIQDLTSQQEAEDVKIETVNSFIEIYNERLQVKLHWEMFEYLINSGVAEIKAKVKDVAERQLQAEKEAIERAEREAKEKAERGAQAKIDAANAKAKAEAEAKVAEERRIEREKAEAERKEQQRIADEREAQLLKENERIKKANEQKVLAAKAEVLEQTNDFIPIEATEEEKKFVTQFKIRHTQPQLEALKAYLAASGIEVL